MNITIIWGIAVIVIICLFFTPLILFIGTAHSRHLKKMKNLTEVHGRVIKREYVEFSGPYDEGLVNHYQVTYDFEDHFGDHYVKRFDTVRCPFKEGDNILVYYDAANPNDSVTAHEVKMSEDAPRHTFFAMLIFIMICIALYLFFMWAKGW